MNHAFLFNSMRYPAIVVIGGLLFLQAGGALGDECSIEPIKPSAGDTRKQLLTATLDETFPVLVYALTRGPKLFQDTLLELNTLPENQKSVLQPIIKEMAEFVAETEDLQVSVCVQSALSLFFKMLDLSSVMQNVEKQPTTESEIALKNAFENNGLKDFQEGYQEKLNVFYDEFEKTLDEYLPKLTEKERERLAGLKQWIREFDTESIPTRKYELFHTIVNFIMA